MLKVQRYASVTNVVSWATTKVKMKEWEKSKEDKRLKSIYKASPFPKVKTGGSKNCKFSDAELNLQQSSND